MSKLTDAILITTANAYKAGKLYSLKPFDGTGDFDVVRATTAWRRNAAGIWESVANNVPRLHYPVGGGCPSVLVEPQRTNLVLRSQEFDNAYWVKSTGVNLVTITPNDRISPDGLMTADRINGLTTTSNIQRLQDFGAGEFTMSIWVYAETLTSFRMFARADSVFINITHNITEINKWIRYSWTITSLISLENLQFFRFGDPSNTYWIWQAQLEEGTTATSIIPTTSATVTRNRDDIVNSAASDIIGQTEGTFFIHAKLNYGTSANTSWFSISDGTNNNRMRIMRGVTVNTIRIIFQLNGSVVQYDFTHPLDFNTAHKIAVRYKSGDIAVSIDGVIINTSTNSLLYSAPLTLVGFTSATSINDMDVSNEYYEMLLFEKPFTNTELETLTTL